MASAENPIKKHKKVRRGNSGKAKKINDQISIMHMNIRGIKSKVRDINSLAEEMQFDIMIFSETKLCNEEKRNIRGYKSLCLNRTTRAGGVAVYYKENMDVQLVKRNAECETLWVKIKGKTEDLVIGGIYSPCENNISKAGISDFVRELEKDLLEIKENVTNNILMVGDMNAHVGNDDEGIKENDEKIGINGKEYRRFWKERDLTLCNNTDTCKGKWTRVSGDSRSILDLTVATEDAFKMVEMIEVDEANRCSIESRKAKTDHNATIVTIKMKVEKEKEKKREIIRCNGNWAAFNEALQSEIQNITSYDTLEKAIQKASKKVVWKEYRIPRKPKIFGYNKALKDEIKRRRELCTNWKKEKNLERRRECEKFYLAQKEKVNNLMDHLEAEEVQKIIDKNAREGIDFWKTMKRIKKKPPTFSKIRNERGEITNNVTEILEEKRKYFHKLYSKPMQTAEEAEEEKEILTKIRELYSIGNDASINQRIDPQEVEDSINRSKNGAAGPDEITNMMLKNSVEILKNPLCDAMNGMKENQEDFPSSWELGDIISFFKGKGDPYDMVFQRGITLTSCVLKILENVVGNRVEPMIRKESTPLQGGGKKGESPEEYIFALQTVIDINKKANKSTKIIITDVEKAFDQAWRIGVFKNLIERGIHGEILELIWKMNDNAKARIKENSVSHSEVFDVEESLKQGGGLSAILYAQHIGAVIENLEREELGPKVGNIHVPALAWQDDVTLLPKDIEEEPIMIKSFENSTDENRVKLAIEKKTKALIVGKEDSIDPTVMKNKVVKVTNEARILGYMFNNKGNPDTHLESRESESIAMMANMGLSIDENNMGRIYLISLLILYEKSFVMKMLHGLSGIPMNEYQWDKLELIDRKVLRNFLNLPSSTPNISLYNEMGIIPIKYMLWRRKLGMWWRLNREESNQLMKQCVSEQINLSLPWIVELNSIASRIKVDLTKAKEMSKDQWKRHVKEKVLVLVEEKVKVEVEKLKGYNDNIKDEIVIGKKKRYITMNQKKAKIWFRMRADIIDPAPRQPYHPKSKWKCKFCDANEQSTEHYVKHCNGIEDDAFQGLSRDTVYSIIQTLECDEQTFHLVTSTIQKIYYLINK